MQTVTKSNFNFLQKNLNLQEFYNTAVTAEECYVNGDFDGELAKLRKIAENLVKKVLDLEHCSIGERDTFNDNLKKLRNLNKIEDKNIINFFYKIKNTGNSAAHTLERPDKDTGLRNLYRIHYLLHWFATDYLDISDAPDFSEPKDNNLYKTTDRKVIYVQTADNSDNMWPAYKGLEKVGDATVDEEIDSRANSDDLKKAANDRINQYMETAGVPHTLQWVELAYSKKNKSWFRDYDVHNILKRSGVKKSNRVQGQEWYETNVDTVKEAIKAVKEGRSSIDSSVQNKYKKIILRPEQEEAIKKTINTFKNKNDMLWNAKMRFGKTLTALELIKEEKYNKVLIMTHRPVVDDSWFEDFNKMELSKEGYYYGSKNKGESIENLVNSEKPYIYFASIQDLRGSKIFGGKVGDKNELIAKINWDLVIIDEAHEGTQTSLAQNVLKKVRKNHTKCLQLSGTPFNILDNYDEDEVYTWDYVMEQSAKYSWDKDHPNETNPYEDIPKVSMYTFEMNKYFNDTHFINIEDKSFNFMEFFKVDKNTGRFIYEHNVKKFLDNITTPDSRTNYPFSTEKFRNELRHTLWLLPSVASARALKDLMQDHKVFKNYKIINIVDDGRADDESLQSNANDVQRVKDVITDDPSSTKTITLTVRKLTTGVTVKPWTAVIFLSNTSSPMAYLQAAFRAQTPYSDEKFGRKTNAYIFDFAPDRALKIMSESANLNTGVGKRNSSVQEKEMKKLLNFLPIIGEQGQGMKPYNVDSLLTKLKRVYAEKAVKTGFDDDSIYSDELLMLDDVDLNDFNNLKAIVGTTKKEKKPVEIQINNQNLTDEEYDDSEKARKKQKKDRTPEEQAVIDKVNELKKQKKTMISILRSVSIRIPLMIYGMDLDVDKDIDINSFLEKVDDESWKEFMPKGVTKGLFRKFIKYYDTEVFIEAGHIIRNKVKAYDNLDPEMRTEKIAEIFSTFKNPDKETVLTPWKVVNMQLGKTVGGLSFFDDKFDKTTVDGKNAMHWIQNELTDNVFEDSRKILEINSKTGLYPLYMATSFYHKEFEKLNEYTAGKFSLEDEQRIWKSILEKNIYVIAKTPMAKTITERTLCGFKNYSTNIKYIENIIDDSKNDIENEVRRVKEEFNVMKFDVVVGNPPYQDNSYGANDSYAKPIYNLFMNLAYSLADISVLITPARFLFNAGSTPKKWNEKMLNNPHFKVIKYEAESKNIFPNTDIKGGVVISLFNKNENYGKIKIFTKYAELNKLAQQFYDIKFQDSMSSIIYSKDSYHFSDVLLKDFPKVTEKTSKGHEKDVSSNIFSILPEIFINENNINSKDLIGIYGRENNERVEKFIDPKYIRKHDNLMSYKILMPGANGSGKFGEKITKPFIAGPKTGHTATFISVGAFSTKSEAKNALKYIKTKFSRGILGILKVTPRNGATSWKLVPKQNFSEKSDINWEKSIKEIDNQLYKKYNLSDKEIDFIEKNVQEMR
ncbi:Eco57I restriction-modification methylase domain-containing protein [Ligilactobacillus sp. LYQ135]